MLPAPGELFLAAQAEVCRTFSIGGLMRDLAEVFEDSDADFLARLLYPGATEEELWGLQRGELASPQPAAEMPAWLASSHAGVGPLAASFASRFAAGADAVVLPALEAVAFCADQVERSLEDIEALGQSVAGLAETFAARGQGILEASGALFVGLPQPLFVFHWTAYQLFAAHALAVVLVVQLRVLSVLGPCPSVCAFGCCAALLECLCAAWTYWAVMGVLHDLPRRRSKLSAVAYQSLHDADEEEGPPCASGVLGMQRRHDHDGPTHRLEAEAVHYLTPVQAPEGQPRKRMDAPARKEQQEVSPARRSFGAAFEEHQRRLQALFAAEVLPAPLPPISEAGHVREVGAPGEDEEPSQAVSVPVESEEERLARRKRCCSVLVVAALLLELAALVLRWRRG